MTKRLKDELETLTKWRTVIRNLPETESRPSEIETLREELLKLKTEYELLGIKNDELKAENARLLRVISSEEVSQYMEPNK